MKMEVHVQPSSQYHIGIQSTAQQKAQTTYSEEPAQLSKKAAIPFPPTQHDSRLPDPISSPPSASPRNALTALLSPTNLTTLAVAERLQLHPEVPASSPERRPMQGCHAAIISQLPNDRRGWELPQRSARWIRTGSPSTGRSEAGL